MDDVTIERERATDHADIATVVSHAFNDARIADMVSAIRSSDRYRPELTLVARFGPQLVGFVMLSGTDLIDTAGTCRIVLTLTPLAVLPDFQRRGIGSALVGAAIADADRAAEPLVVLEGSPSFYGRLGFQPATAHNIHIDLPEWAPEEAAQVHPLTLYDTQVRGRVHYPPAIAEVGN